MFVFDFLWQYHGKWSKRARWRLKVDRTCDFHGYSEEKAPFPCDIKLPPAKMSAYRCPFYGYIMKNDPKYKLIRLHVHVRTNPDSKAFQNSLSSLVFIHKFRPFWQSCGGRVFRNGKQRFFNRFSRFRPISRMSVPFPMLHRWRNARWRLKADRMCHFLSFFDDYIDEKRSRTWNTYF